MDLLELSKDITEGTVDSGCHGAVLLEHIHAVLAQKYSDSSFSVEDLSERVGMSRMTLHRKLKALTGSSANSLIKYYRLHAAAELLKKDSVYIAGVGYTVGFNNPSYFTKCFRDQFFCTPGEFATRFKRKN